MLAFADVTWGYKRYYRHKIIGWSTRNHRRITLPCIFATWSCLFPTGHNSIKKTYSLHMSSFVWFLLFSTTPKNVDKVPLKRPINKANMCISKLSPLVIHSWQSHSIKTLLFRLPLILSMYELHFLGIMCENLGMLQWWPLVFSPL